MIAESAPNAAMGITSDMAVAANATAVVREVTKIALDARRAAYVTRVRVVPETAAGSYALCLNASKNTNTSSAPTPSTTNTERIWMFPRYDTRKNTRYRKMDTGKLARISNMPRVATNAEPVCAAMYTHTARIDAPAHDRSYPMIR
jgi:hypothetical protein